MGTSRKAYGLRGTPRLRSALTVMVQIDPICMVTGPPELDPAAVQVGGYVRKAP